MISIKIAFENFKIGMKKLQKEIAVLFLAYKRSDVHWYAKIFAIIIVGYALSPIDFIPDFIPILGYIDDLILIPLGILLVIKLIPPEILDECRNEAKELFKDGKPKNYIAAAIIVLIWIIIVGTVIFKVFL